MVFREQLVLFVLLVMKHRVRVIYNFLTFDCKAFLNALPSSVIEGPQWLHSHTRQLY